MEYYELHITMVSDNIPFLFSAHSNTILGIETWSDFIRFHVEKLGWTYSRIDGDPVEGPGIKHYATRHLNGGFNRKHVKEILDQAVESLKSDGITVTRDKIELVIHDSSSTKVRI